MIQKLGGGRTIDHGPSPAHMKGSRGGSPLGSMTIMERKRAVTPALEPPSAMTIKRRHR